MDKDIKRKIFETLLSGKSDGTLDDLIRGWMSVHRDDPEIESLFHEYFDIKVRQRTPTRKTYRKLQEIERRLGFRQSAVVRIPVTKRLGFRIAAALIPVLIVAGALLDHHRPQQYISMPVAEELTPEQAVAGDTATAAAAEPFVEVRRPEPAPEPPLHVDAAPRYDINYHAEGVSERYVTLPDNSTALLRRGSRLAYSTPKREVFLEGDAYFIVAKNGSVPFRVVSANITVEVTGTEFGMTVWPGGEQDRVALAAGSVNVKTKENKSVRMRPMQEFAYSARTRKIELVPWDGQGWWMGFITFDDRPISEIVSELGAYYGVEISGTEIMDDTGYTIKFDKRSSLDNALSVLEECAPRYRFERSGSRITVKMN